MNKQTVPFTKEAVKKYLDDCIIFSRKIYDSGGKEAAMCAYYIDAYQSIRTSLFGETLPLNDMIPEDFHMPSVLKDVNLEFDDDAGVTMPKNMMRIGDHMMDKDDIEHIALNWQTSHHQEGITITMRSGAFIEFSGSEAKAVRAFLIKQFPCEGQTLWL